MEFWWDILRHDKYFNNLRSIFAIFQGIFSILKKSSKFTTAPRLHHKMRCLGACDPSKNEPLWFTVWQWIKNSARFLRWEFEYFHLLNSFIFFFLFSMIPKNFVVGNWRKTFGWPCYTIWQILTGFPLSLPCQSVGFECSQTGEETLSTNSENRGHKATLCVAIFKLFQMLHRVWKFWHKIFKI